MLQKIKERIRKRKHCLTIGRVRNLTDGDGTRRPIFNWFDKDLLSSSVIDLHFLT